jgi:hypothetical protein
MAIAHLFCAVSIKHVSWCELEYLLIKKRFVAVFGKGGNDCIDMHNLADNLS